jgi:hypothetical protein
MSNIILNIVIILAVFVPMAYFMFAGNADRANAKLLKAKLNEMGLSPDVTGYFQSAGIALDKSKSQICFFQYEENKVTNIQVKDVASAEVIKLYQTESVHDQDTSILKSVTLLLKQKDKTDIKMPIYQVDKLASVGSDLMEAVRWSELINKLISK